jgi:3-phosphoshikimate 1-carboxyvinyltransferase
MNITISPSALRGTVNAIPSKSVAHRALICAALAKIRTGEETQIECAATSADIEATRTCLKALGSGKSGLLPKVLKCGESGSTFRFLLPVVAALGCNCEFQLEGRLPERPLSPLYEELVKQGCTLSPQGSNPFKVKGKLHPGHFIIDAGVSSQFISGLLFALPLLSGTSTIRLWNNIESASYINLTTAMVERFGIKYDFDGTCFVIPGNQTYRAPKDAPLVIEGDWSNAAFWLCANFIRRGENDVCVDGLSFDSGQGDSAIVEILGRFRDNEGLVEIDAADIPDLVPILAVTATAIGLKGTTTHIYNAERLRTKESDRLAAVTEMLSALGADITERKDGLEIIGGKPLRGGVTVSSHNDHRIAMAAAIAATMCGLAVTIEGADAVNKSYPGFFEDLKSVGGNAKIRW